MKELNFRPAASIMSRLGVQRDCFTKVCWLAVFYNFVCDKAYFKLLQMSLFKRCIF